MSTLLTAPREPVERHHGWAIGAAAVLWLTAYPLLDPASRLAVSLLPLAADSHLAVSIQFFLYETPKVLMLLTAIVFVMGVVHSFVRPERTRAILSGRRAGVGNLLSAGLGTVTPFCSCSAVPMFIGFLQAGVPLGVTFSFLIAAPMVNEVAFGMLLSLVGLEVAALYLAMGLLVAISAGLIIGAMGLDDQLEDWVRELRDTPPLQLPSAAPTWQDRLGGGIDHVRDIVGKVWLYIVGGVLLGAGIHGYVPEDFMASFMGQDVWWAVPAAVLLGIPMYTNAAGVIPIVQALLAKGAALGTALAFMMSVIALSAPELVILRKVLKPRLIGVFVAIVALGILAVGFLFNALL